MKIKAAFNDVNRIIFHLSPLTFYGSLFYKWLYRIDCLFMLPKVDVNTDWSGFSQYMLSLQITAKFVGEMMQRYDIKYMDKSSLDFHVNKSS